MTVHPTHPLPPDLQQLIDSSGEDGVIIVSFGSNVASVLDKEKVDIMAKAFGRLKQTFIWRQQGINFFLFSPSPIFFQIHLLRSLSNINWSLILSLFLFILNFLNLFLSCLFKN